MNEKLLFSEIEAARILSLSTKTLARLRKAGKLNFVRIGSAVRYDLQSLLTWIDASKAA